MNRWTGIDWLLKPGRAAWIAVAVLIVLAVLQRDLAEWLCSAAGIIAVIAWLSDRRREEITAAAVPTGAAVASPPSLEMDDRARRLLDSVFESLDDPVLIVSGGASEDAAARRVILANASARDLMKVSREGAQLVSAIRDPDVLEAVDEGLFGGVSRTVDYNGGGSPPRQWKASVRPLPSMGVSPLALLTLRDETDLRRTEKMRVDFLANASHELRTPLASLSGFIETLKGHARDDVGARDRFLDIMAVQADRMGRLIADLMSLSRIELNEHIPPQGSTDLSRAALDVVDAVGLLSRSKGVDIDMGGDPKAMVEGDRDEIIQVIQNLVDNAVKYAPSGSAVQIDIRAGQRLDSSSGPRADGVTRLSLVTPARGAGSLYAILTVRDHGPGMEREHLPRLTERFYRVEGQKSGARSGTGLGLAIVKHIVNRHRGGLAVESAPGLGATFMVYFPMAYHEKPTVDLTPESALAV